MSVKSFIILTIIGLMALGCGKKENPNPTPPKKDMYYLPQDAHDYFNYQLGEKRVYLDSTSGELDTLICEDVDRFNLKNVYGNEFLFYEEAFIIRLKSSRDGLFIFISPNYACIVMIGKSLLLRKLICLGGIHF